MSVNSLTSARMRACINKNSTIELALRKALWKAGYRYRANYAKLPGKPDVAFTKLKIAIFCDGEFWHGKDWDRRKHDFKANKQFWIDKIERNMQRDEEVNEKLEALGWLVIRFWESDIKKRLDECVTIVKASVISRLDDKSNRVEPMT